MTTLGNEYRLVSSEILNKWFNQYIIFRNTEQMVQPIHYLQEYWSNGSTNTLPSEILNKWFNQYITFRNTEHMVQPIHYLQKYWTNGSTNTLSSGTPNIWISLKWSKYTAPNTFHGVLSSDHYFVLFSCWIFWVRTRLWPITDICTVFDG